MTDADDIAIDEELAEVQASLDLGLLARGYNPAEVLRNASENITAWQAHTAVCRYTCAECREHRRLAVFGIVNEPECSTIIEPEDA